MLISIVLYCWLGAIAGLLAGLLGIGGGAVIVPMLVFAFNWQNISPDVAMHMAIGTSLGSIIFTAFSSAMAHHSKDGVDWRVFRGIALGILAGTYWKMAAALFCALSLLCRHQHAAQQEAQSFPHAARLCRTDRSRTGHWRGFKPCRHRRRHAFRSVSRLA